MRELSRALQEFPQLNSWRPDPEHPGLYLHLVKKPFRTGLGPLRAKDVSLEALGEHLPEPILEAPLYVEEDFSEQYEVSEKHPEIVKELVELAEKHKAEMKIKASVCDFGR